MGKENELDLRRFFGTISKHYYLYILSLAIVMGLAILYTATRMDRYDLMSSLLIEEPVDDLPQGGGGEMNSFVRAFSIGSFGSSSTENEKLLLSTYDIKLIVVKNLGLNRTYYTNDGLKKRMLTPAEAPIAVEAPVEMFDTLSTPLRLKVKLLSDGKANITLSEEGLFGARVCHVEGATLPHELSTHFGPLRILKNDDSTVKSASVSITSYKECARGLDEAVAIEAAGRLSDGLALFLTYPNEELGMTILNAIMTEYNNKRLARKWDNADLEIKFYDDRITSLYNELSEAENNIERLKRSNNLVAISEEAPILIEDEYASQKVINEELTERSYYERILSMTTDDGDTSPLPIVSQFRIGESTRSLIERYNSAVLSRRELMRSAKGENRVLRQLNDRIANLKTDIAADMRELIAASELKISAHRRSSGSTMSRIKELPAHEREYITLLRDQKMKDALYNFLLERRENAILKRYSSATLGFVFQEAYCIKKNTKTRIIILAVSFLLALLLPTLWIIRKMKTGCISRRYDLDFLNLEQRTAVMSLPNPDLSDLLSLIMLNPDRKIIFTYDLTKTTGNPARAIGDAIAGLGLKSTVIDDGSETSASHPLNQQFSKLVADECTCNDYVIVPLPHSSLSVMRQLFKDDNTQLIVLLEEGLTPRRKFKEMIQPIITLLPVSVGLFGKESRQS